MRILLLVVFVFSSATFAHTRLKASTGFVPRSTNPGLKTGPCGGIARTSTPAQYKPGDTISITWEETIDHPGHFEFYFSPEGDKNWRLLKTVDDTQDDPTTVPHQYSTTLTMPNETCTDCTLQLIQVMTENPVSPSLYYSCADIQLQSTSGAQSPSTTPAKCD